MPAGPVQGPGDVHPSILGVTMKITDVRTFLVHDSERPERNYSFVKIYTDEGLTGLGEAGINGKELALQGLVETYRPS